MLSDLTLWIAWYSVLVLLLGVVGWGQARVFAPGCSDFVVIFVSFCCWVYVFHVDRKYLVLCCRFLFGVLVRE